MTGGATLPRSHEHWDWLAVALFLLLTVDMLTTLAAARVVGVAAEANPLVQWALAEGVWTLLALNLVALVVAVALFGHVTGRLARIPSPGDRYAAVLVEVWLGTLVAAGLAVFANNLSVIVMGESLL